MSVAIRLAAARATNTLGRQMVTVTVGWELYERTRSALVLGAVGLVQVLPVVLLFLPAGLAADRGNRRHLAAGAVAVTGACGVALAVVGYAQAPIAWYLAILGLLGTATAFHTPASAAVITMVIPREALTQYNRLGTAAYEVSAISGPTLAGLLLTVLAPWQVYALVALTALASTALYLSLPATPRLAENATVQARRDWRVGLRFIFSSPLLLPALTLDLFAVLFAGATALLPMVAREVLHTGPLGLGILRSASSVGAITMALISAQLAPWRRPGVVLLRVVAMYGVATIGFGLAQSVWGAAAWLCIGGALDYVSVVIRLTLEQMVVPDAIRGRVSAVHYVFIGMSNELGELESGVAAHLLGVVPAIVGGGALAICVVALVAWRSRALRQMPPLAELRPPPGV